MLYKAERTKLDVEHLVSEGNAGFPDPECEADYRGVVVNKPWGYEYLMFKNSHMEIWVLFINNGCATSMHCHRYKKTSLSVLAGTAEFRTCAEKIALSPFDAVIIDPETFHSTLATSENGAIVMEVETPSNKRDLIRIEDLYGRELKGYEGGSHISKELHKYDYCYFASVKDVGERSMRGGRLRVIESRNLTNVRNGFNENIPKIIIILEGKILDAVGDGIAYPGDIMTGEDFKEALSGNCYLSSGNVSILTIAQENHV